ncbi:MAG TPA: hypothetical protein VNW06_11480, partial [Cytophagaceae bacterium]|nr:hypothetical protein [Cytophagaceae bacterium]
MKKIFTLKECLFFFKKHSYAILRIKENARKLRYHKFILSSLLIISSYLNLKADVLYTSLSPNKSLTLSSNSSGTGLLPLDLNNDGTPDFNFNYSADATGTVWNLTIVPQNNNEVLQVSTGSYAGELSVGDLSTATPNASFLWGGVAGNALLGDNNDVHYAGTGDQYIGVRIKNGSNYNYGWIRVSLSATPYILTIKDFALEGTVNTDIVTSNSLSNITTTSQTLNFSTSDNSDFYSCGANKNYTLTLTPTISSLNGTILVKISDASNGLYINSVATSNNSNVKIDLSQSDNKTIALVVQNLNTPAQIMIPVYAGYCNLFADLQSSVSLTGIFSVGNNLSIANNVNLTVYKGPSLLVLDETNTAPTTIHAASPDPNNNNLATFQFALVNNAPSGKDFNGWIVFEEDPAALGIALDIRNVQYYIYDPATATETLISTISNPITNTGGNPNDNSFTLIGNANPNVVYVSIPKGSRLLIKEEIRVNGCLVSPNGNARPRISWGCGSFDNLKSFENCSSDAIDTKIEVALTAAFTFMDTESSYYHTYSCIN